MDYKKTIPANLSPSPPSLDDILDKVRGSSNSCPGPNGIKLTHNHSSSNTPPPMNSLSDGIFSGVFHMMIQTALLYRETDVFCTTWCISQYTPVPRANKPLRPPWVSILFFNTLCRKTIPSFQEIQGVSLWVNMENRLVARILVENIIPAAKTILNPAQKGFVPGRQGKDHIEDITSNLYSNLSKKKQTYILFLDTEKAFNSLDHSYFQGTCENEMSPLVY